MSDKDLYDFLQFGGIVYRVCRMTGQAWHLDNGKWRLIGEWSK